MRSVTLIGTLVALGTVVARGDTPLPPPARTTASSPNGHIRATSDPQVGTQIEDVTQHKVLWRLPDWYRSMFVPNDGRHLVTQYDGLNLIPIDFRDDLVLITFWREGRKVNEIKVRDLFPDHSILQRTASHYAWGKIDGFNAHGRLEVRRIDGKQFLFDVATGKTTKP